MSKNPETASLLALYTEQLQKRVLTQTDDSTLDAGNTKTAKKKKRSKNQELSYKEQRSLWIKELTIIYFHLKQQFEFGIGTSGDWHKFVEAEARVEMEFDIRDNDLNNDTYHALNQHFFK